MKMTPAALPWSQNFWEIRITHCVSTMNICGNLVNNYSIKRFKQLKQDMLQISPCKVDTISVNQVYLVKYNNTWYRVCIEKQDDKTNGTLCFFLDYGYTLPVNITDLYVCEPRFLCVEAQALRFSLIGLESLKNNKDATAKLKSLINQHVIVQVHTKQANYVSCNLIPTPIMVSIYDSNMNNRFLEEFTSFPPTVDINKIGTTAVTITHITKDGYLYVRPNDVKWQRLDETIHGLTSKPENLLNYRVQRQDFNFGKIYLIIDNVDTLASNGDASSVPFIKWFRGTLANLKCSIEYDDDFAMEDIDTGAIRIVRFSDIYILEEVRPDFIAIPRLCIKVAVHHIKDVSNELVELLNMQLNKNEKIMVEVASADKVPAVFVYKPLDNEIENLYTINYQIISQYGRNILEIPNNCLDAANNFAFKEEISKSFAIDEIESDKLAKENIGNVLVDEDNEVKVKDDVANVLVDEEIEVKVKVDEKVATIATVGNTDANNEENEVKIKENVANVLDEEIEVKVKDDEKVAATIDIVGNTDANNLPAIAINSANDNLSAKNDTDVNNLLASAINSANDNLTENETFIIEDALTLLCTLNGQSHIEKKKEKEPKPILGRGIKGYDVLTTEDYEIENKKLQNQIIIEKDQNAAANVDYDNLNNSNYIFSKDGVIFAIQKPIPPPTAMEAAAYKEAALQAEIDDLLSEISVIPAYKEAALQARQAEIDDFLSEISVIPPNIALQEINLENSTKNSQFDNEDIKSHYLGVGKENQPAIVRGLVAKKIEAFQKLQDVKYDRKSTKEIEEDVNDVKSSIITNQPPATLQYSNNQFNVEQQKLHQEKVADSKLQIQNTEIITEAEAAHVEVAVKQNKPLSAVQNRFIIDPIILADIKRKEQAQKMREINEPASDLFAKSDAIKSKLTLSTSNENTNKFEIRQDIQQMQTNIIGDGKENTENTNKFEILQDIQQKQKNIIGDGKENTEKVCIKDVGGHLEISNDLKQDQSSLLVSQNKFQVEPKLLETFKSLQDNVGDNAKLISTKDSINQSKESIIEGNKSNAIDAGRDQSSFLNSSNKFSISIKQLDAFKKFQLTKTTDYKVNEINVEANVEVNNNKQNEKDTEMQQTSYCLQPIDALTSQAEKIQLKADVELKDSQEGLWRSSTNKLKVNSMQLDAFKKSQNDHIADAELLATIPEMLVKQPAELGVIANEKQQISWRSNGDSKKAEMIAKQSESTVKDTDGNGGQQSWRLNCIYNADTKENAEAQDTNFGNKQYKTRFNESENVDKQTSWRSNNKYNVDLNKIESFRKSQVIKYNDAVSEAIASDDEFIKQFNPDIDAKKFHAFKQILKDNVISSVKESTNHNTLYDRAEKPTQFGTKKYSPWSIECKEFKPNSKVLDADQANVVEQIKYSSKHDDNSKETTNKNHLRLDAPVFQYSKAKTEQKWSDNNSNGGKLDAKQFPKWLNPEKISELEFKPGKYKSLVEQQNTEVKSVDSPNQILNASNNDKTYNEQKRVQVPLQAASDSQRSWYPSEIEFKSKTVEHDRELKQSTEPATTVEPLKNNDNIEKPAINLQSQETKPTVSAVVPGSLRGKLDPQKYVSLKERLNKWKIKDANKTPQEANTKQSISKDNNKNEEQQISNTTLAKEMKQITTINKVTENKHGTHEPNGYYNKSISINNATAATQTTNFNDKQKNDDSNTLKYHDQDAAYDQYQKQNNLPLKIKDNYYDGVTDNGKIPKPKWPYDTKKKETTSNDSGVDLENSDNDYLEYIQKFRLNNCPRYRNCVGAGGLPPQLGPLQKIVEVPKLKTYDQVPDINGYFEVNVTAVTNPTNFMIQPIRDISLLVEMEKDLNVYCKKNIEPIPAHLLEIGEAYAVEYSNGSFKRAILKKILDNGKIANINFCDFGVLCSVRSDDLRALPVKFRELPMMALQASLHYQADWNAGHCNIFREICLLQRFYAVVKDVVVENEERRTISVDLITLKDEHQYVHELMLLGIENNSNNN